MDASMTLSVPRVNQQHAMAIDFFDEPIFLSNEHHPLMILSNSPSLNEDIEAPHGQHQLLLSRNLSMETPIRTSELLDDIRINELDKLKSELKLAKQELNEMNETHNEQIDNFQTKIKKVKAQGEFLNILKEQKQRTSMKDLQMNYESELQQINRKLMITQSLHVSEIKKIRKSQVKHKLEIKLAEKKIKQLMTENAALINEKQTIKKNAQFTAEKLKTEFNQQMEQEVNKRIAQISQLKKAKNKIIQELHEKNAENMTNNQEIDMKQDEKDKLICRLKDKIKELERAAEKEQDMFFKHSEIFDYKLEREIKERKSIEKKLLQQKVEYEMDIKILNDKIVKLKHELSQENELNIRLHENIKMVIDENKRLKDMESDYQLFTAHIDADYDEMNGMLEELQNKNKQKEEELSKVKEFVQEKENENKTLRISVNSNANTIKELETMLNGLKTNENEFENKKKEIDDLNKKINDKKGENSALNENKTKHKYSTSYISCGVDNEMHMKHIGELESIKIEYNELINNMKTKHQGLETKYIQTKKELICSNELLKEIESSKVELATNFAVEMNRIRGIIRKQNKSVS